MKIGFAYDVNGHVRSGTIVGDGGVAAGDRPSVREVLRSATGSAHRRLDAVMSTFDLGDRAGYRAFLEVHRSSLRILSHRWGRDEHGDFATLLAEVEKDLDGETAAAGDATTGSASDWPREAGVAYVLRGSRFGASVLRRQVGAGWPCNYLDYQTVLAWPAFVARLEARSASVDHAGLKDMIDAADGAFRVFADVATPGPDR